jgi:hypothetical protein
MPLLSFSLDLRGALASSIQAHLLLVTKHPSLVFAAATTTTGKEEKQPEIQQTTQTTKPGEQNNQSNKALSENSKNNDQDMTKSMMRTDGMRLEYPLLSVTNKQQRTLRPTKPESQSDQTSQSNPSNQGSQSNKTQSESSINDDHEYDRWHETKRWCTTRNAPSEYLLSQRKTTNEENHQDQSNQNQYAPRKSEQQKPRFDENFQTTDANDLKCHLSVRETASEADGQDWKPKQQKQPKQ